MSRWFRCVFHIASLLILALPVPVFALPSPADCALCIVEFQTQGFGGANEEYVIIGNNTNDVYDTTGVTVKYFTAAGNANSKTITMSGLLAPQSVIAFVGEGLKIANSNVGSFPAGLAFADAGGTLQLLKNGEILDQVGWGTATLRETAASVSHERGASLTREQVNGFFQDTGNNTDDFANTAHACTGLSVNELQPFLIDMNGSDIDPAIEVIRPADAVIDQDCPLVINGSYYAITAGDLQQSAGIASLTHVLNNLNNEAVIPLLAVGSNTLQFMPTSSLGDIILPGASLTQPVLLPGQSYAKFSSGWKATYTPTLGSANQLATSPPVQGEEPPVVTDSCSDAYMSELLPNPVGEDTGQEWLELSSTSSASIFLANCVLIINGTQYVFAADQAIEPGENVLFKEVSDGITTRSLSFKNGSLNTVSFGHFDSTGSFQPLQTIQYQDALDGQSWARFDDGWRWLSSPTPGQVNDTVTAPPSDLEPTEFPTNNIDGPTDTSTDDNPTTSPTILITELLPNPVAPATDENDEYIELYNPNADPVDLDGYKVQTGSNYTYSFTIDAQTVPAAGYLVLTSGSTGLTLANTAGRARLLNPAGAVVSETDAYTDAVEGVAWAFIQDKWQWTGIPTAGTANVFSSPETLGSSTKTSKKASAKTSTAKPKSATVKAAKTSKTKTAAATGVNTDTANAQPQALHPGVLVAIGSLAVVYAAYEYRQDMANTLYKLRRNRAVRRSARP